MRRKSAGRPAYKPTAVDRRKVSIAAGGGMSHEAISMVLGISRNTLEKHFERELTSGAYERRFEAMQGLHVAAKKGNVSAVKAYLSGVPEFLPPPPGATETKAAPPAVPALAVGKKDAANAAAKTAQVGTGWEALLPGPMPLQ